MHTEGTTRIQNTILKNSLPMFKDNSYTRIITIIILIGSNRLLTMC